MRMKLASLTRALLSAAEKAAYIARKIREIPSLSSLLVQEKTEADKNPKFVRDFKTLADVLIQEVTKHDLAAEFPTLKGHVFGEEDSTFISANGDSCAIAISDNHADTAKLLAVLLHDVASAEALAAAAHSTAPVEIPEALQSIDVDLDDDDLAVWIDPIDSTEQYILGIENPTVAGNIFVNGLPCVTVLIGAFRKSSGEPICGVAIRPFERQLPDGCWTSSALWGAKVGEVTASSLRIGSNDVSSSSSDNAWASSVGSTDSRPRYLAVVSKQELTSSRRGVAAANAETERSGIEGGDGGRQRELPHLPLGNCWEYVTASGAGSKLLAVALGEADVFCCRSPTVYEWDVCGPHSILRSVGGGIVDYRSTLDAVTAHLKAGGSLATAPFECFEIRYRSKLGCSTPIDGAVVVGSKHCLDGGFVAYRSRDRLVAFFSTLV